MLFGGTVRENIAHGKADATDAEIEAAAKLANAHDFVAALPEGYETPVGEQGVQLSGGQKQRVAIARAIVRDPAILVLDEATASVDWDTDRLIQETVRTKFKGSTVLVIAHRLGPIIDTHKVMVLSRGELREFSSPAELLRSPDSYFSKMISEYGAEVWKQAR